MKRFPIAFLTVSFLSLFSCKKVIDVKETDFIGGDIALQTVNNNHQALIGAYAGLNYEMDILFNAVLSDEVKVAEFYNSGTVHEWQFGPEDVPIRDQFTAITPYYRVIDRVNRVLQALPNAQATQTGDEALRSRIRGEALFLRAFSHFELVRYYSDNYTPNGLAMAYMETPSLAPTARITMEPYFQKINQDLTAAKDLVPSSLADVGRANRIAVSGLQARVALYMRDWQNAIIYSTEYIDALPLATRAQFPSIWSDASNTEVAFKLIRTAQLSPFGRLGSLFRGTSANATQIGSITWVASEKLWNSYDKTNDIRFPTYFTDEPLLSAAGRPSRLISKYAGGGYGTSTENVADVKVFRTGEMYLIRAEAKAETNDLPGAAADLNALRAARIAGYVNETFTTKEQLIDAIIFERFRELAYEGHRFWDLRRRNLPVQRLPQDAPNANALTLPAGNFRFVLPIPQREIEANPQIQQNPGYE
ncbi:MAG TPA: RagB/SusD family nutrient uptake outer membrane protein [Flavisolibacter sp.]|nr:RagB/SusD family nutrient uptake outer membrane protein [Flavisolibacter sp.]